MLERLSIVPPLFSPESLMTLRAMEVLRVLWCGVGEISTTLGLPGRGEPSCEVLVKIDFS
jgi:hypothetical protein